MQAPPTWQKLLEQKGSIPWDSIILHLGFIPKAEFHYLWYVPFTKILSQEQATELLAELTCPTHKNSWDSTWEYAGDKYVLKIQITGDELTPKYVILLQNAKEAAKPLKEITYTDCTNDPQTYLDLYAS